MANAYRDQNNVPTLIAASNSDGSTPVRLYADPTTHRLLVDLASGGIQVETPTGTVNGVNVTFTTTNTPKEIHADGNVYVAGFGFSYVSPTITMDIAPVNWIRNWY